VAILGSPSFPLPATPKGSVVTVVRRTDLARFAARWVEFTTWGFTALAAI